MKSSPVSHEKNASDTGERAHSKFLFYVALFCVFVIVYASLQPFTGWRQSTENAIGFFTQLTRHVTRADLTFNALAYVPLGFALYAMFPPTWTTRGRWLGMLVFTFALSITVELLQTWLPTRVSSIYDTIANALGACIGAAIATPLLKQHNLLAVLQRWRDAWFVGGATGDLKILLLGIWLLVQINPGIPLFAATFHPGFTTAFDPVVVAVELAQTATALVGIGLFTDLTMRKRALGGIALVIVVATAVGMKTLAAQWLLTPIGWEAWLRPGHALGVAAGAVVLLVLFWLPRVAKSIVAGIALLSSVFIPFLLPDLVTARAPIKLFEWHYGQLLNLNGLTRTIVVLWPLVATLVLLLRFGVSAKNGK
ncbi:MAG: VanZ family protein [Casimicrobium sp.]